MTFRSIKIGLFVLLFATVAFYTDGASARRNKDLLYQKGRVWKTVIRMLRVDYGYAITDRDQDAGYVLFEYSDGSKRVPGSVELIAGKEGKTTAAFSVPAMPSYVELMLLTRLEKKLKADYGAPVAPPKPKPTPDKDENEEKDQDKTGTKNN